MEVSTSPANLMTSGNGGGGVATEEERMKLRGREGGGSQDLQYSSGGGNRWPPEETVALLKIRSEMDASFRDSSLKAPLWEVISRRMSELGYTRSAKKCKEKFENTQKYHKRTKDGRTYRPNGKIYKFFSQLEALENTPPSSMAAPLPSTIQASQSPAIDAMPCSVYSPAMQFVDSSSTSTTSTPSKEESEGTKKKKRKFTEFFNGLLARVVEKQESLQRKFIEAVEKFEKDRMAREEAWKAQELERIKKEREDLARERASVAAKDAAVLAFLQKFSNGAMPLPLPLPLPLQLPVEKVPLPSRAVVKYTPTPMTPMTPSSSSPSRWPKEEIEALIRLRTNLDMQYQESGPKGPLWEEVSLEMKKLGFDRSAKRCKEKWENMNKYFRRVKESSKARPEDSKTCPYFHQLDALYSSGGKRRKIDHDLALTTGVNSGTSDLRPEELLMHMMSQQQQQPESATTDDGGGGGSSENHEAEKEQDRSRVVASSEHCSMPMMEWRDRLEQMTEEVRRHDDHDQ
ncbi:unnamed protein product [Linum tenue]|uniref:Myb-like domain-containing protein n=1 Tax=Linum tenue TaxID=586396 RepID=A0AAV0RFM8_9ROSI|nr:unnamed protein product [Linum tenue]